MYNMKWNRKAVMNNSEIYSSIQVNENELVICAEKNNYKDQTADEFQRK